MEERAGVNECEPVDVVDERTPKCDCVMDLKVTTADLPYGGSLHCFFWNPGEDKVSYTEGVVEDPGWSPCRGPERIYVRTMVKTPNDGYLHFVPVKDINRRSNVDDLGRRVFLTEYDPKAARRIFMRDLAKAVSELEHKAKIKKGELAELAAMKP